MERFYPVEGRASLRQAEGRLSRVQLWGGGAGTPGSPPARDAHLLTFLSIAPGGEAIYSAFSVLHELSPVANHKSMAKLFELPRYIAVEGPIRVGKSTLARVLGERLAAHRAIEPADNPLLNASYAAAPGPAF